MTEQAGKKKTPPAPLAAEEIAAYLKQSPHFFDAHPELLNENRNGSFGQYFPKETDFPAAAVRGLCAVMGKIKPSIALES
ncbi:MAG: hypothetical protein OXU61_09440 [Gammaproteobacteria bacterium]|nr:hypothetical protein [Gammaproteobacteria bacterium]